MSRKTMIIIMIVIGAIVLAYCIMPDLLPGPIDDGVLAALAVCAEVVLGILQAVKKSMESRSSYNYSSYQNNTYSNSSNYQQSNQNDGSAQDEEFQFFAGCTDWEQVKSRYRDLMKIYHPDAGGHEEASKKINAEYDRLKKKFGH